MSDFSLVKNIVIPTSEWARGYSLLRDVGKLGYEGLFLLAGSTRDEATFEAQVWVPKQRGHKGEDGICVVVDGAELHRINVELMKNDLELIGQVHSHPTDAYHSDTDDEFAIANSVGAVSIVIPDFAGRNFDLACCAAYRLMSDGQWQELMPGDLQSLIRFEV